MIERTSEAIAPVLADVQPDVVLVYGDVNGAVGAARAAKKAGVRMAHVEAGLRSFDLTMPEEHNRIEIDHLADELFCTELSAMGNLLHEGTSGRRHFVGNTMIDTLLRMMPLIEQAPLPPGLPERFAVVTLHRPDNVDTEDSLRRNIAFLNDVSCLLPIILPAHPRLRGNLERFHLSLPSGVKLIEPLGYVEFLALVRSSEFVMTDSGGLQEECVTLNKRCFTLRKNTERPATIESGSNVLVDIANPLPTFNHPAITIPPLWDGKAGERIAVVLQGLPSLSGNV